MTAEHKKSYRNGPGYHKVNIFHVYTEYRFLNISCSKCNFASECKGIDHKREICMAAKESEKLLTPFILGWASSFVSDDFFIYIKGKNSKRLSKIIEKLRNKYLSEQYVRE